MTKQPFIRREYIFTISLARKLLAILEEHKDCTSKYRIEIVGRIVMGFSKQIYDFGLSLAEEKTAEDNRNAAGNDDVVTFY